MNATLFLIIKKEWFDKILSGEKLIEYREVKKYYLAKFTDKHYDKIILQNGYAKGSRRLEADIQRISIESVKIPFFGSIERELYCIHLFNPRQTR
jgi:hypothetical protein